MSNRNIITLIIVAALIGGVFLMYNQQAKREAEENAQILGYDQEVFLKEGGYTAARNYGDSIFTELYCNTEDIVYQYAFTDNGIDIPHRELIASFMITSPTENHLYLEYRIPHVKNDFDENGKPTQNWSYTDSYSYAILDMRNISRHAPESYSCGEFSIIDDDLGDVINNALDANAESIESDAVLRKMIDYGVLYNIDEGLASTLAEREKDRISSYLLAQQKENAAPYAFSTTSENGIETVSANLTDHSETIRDAENATQTIDPNATISNNQTIGAQIIVPQSTQAKENAPQPTVVVRPTQSASETQTENNPEEKQDEAKPTVSQSLTPHAGN